MQRDLFLKCGAGAAPPKRARYGPRLTAANYRYIVRGRSEKAAADDVRIAAQRRARLAPYDRDLRQFRHALTALLAIFSASHVKSLHMA